MSERFALIVRKRDGGERRISPDKFWIDRNTPVGEDAQIYERKPWGGRKPIEWRDVIRKEPTP